MMTIIYRLMYTIDFPFNKTIRDGMYFEKTMDENIISQIADQHWVAIITRGNS